MASIPRGFEDVDPRTAERVPLSHELNEASSIFPNDPPFASEVFHTIAGSGYLQERITSLGTHTGTHVSTPAHFVEGAASLSELDESFTLMPLVVLAAQADITPSDVEQFEREHGRIPHHGCVLMRTGFAQHYGTPAYFEPAPGFTREAVTWLFEQRAICALGSDSFGPDATTDREFSASAAAFAHGGITVENVGPQLARMRPYGDWIAINGPRPRMSGFQVGITGFTRPVASSDV